MVAHMTFTAEDTSEAEFKLPRSYQKQLDKEVRWGEIPADEKPLYTAAEEKHSRNISNMVQ